MKKIEITPSQARHGTQVKLRRPDGGLVLVKIPNNTKDGDRLSISRQGLAGSDLLVKIMVKEPSVHLKEEPEMHRKTAQPRDVHRKTAHPGGGFIADDLKIPQDKVKRIMNNDLVQWAVKLIIVGVVVYALYMVMSPYQNCVRSYGEPQSEGHQRGIANDCTRNTAW